MATLDGKSLDLPLDRADTVEAWLDPASGSPHELRIAFRTRGMGEWRYDTFFAPVCLLFFFILVMTITVVHGVSIHPMHYLFVSAGFFAFHLLLAYLADVVAIHAAFAVSAAASLALVTTHLSAALRGRLPWRVALVGQAFFLVLFSYSFFLEGVTGLVVSLGAVATLAILMRVQFTAPTNSPHVQPPLGFLIPRPMAMEPHLSLTASLPGLDRSWISPIFQTMLVRSRNSGLTAFCPSSS